MRVPIIGILSVAEATPEEFPLSGCYQYAINERYVQALEPSGTLSIVLPIPTHIDEEHIKRTLDLIDGLLIPGGADIDPSLYKQKKDPSVGKTFLMMDTFHIAVFRIAYSIGLPILGICRGCQLINVACKGTLYQDIPSHFHAKKSILHQVRTEIHLPCHTVSISSDSVILAKSVKDVPHLGVNSIHHQGIASIGATLRCGAIAEDGLIEAIESEDPSHWVLGVQWHPELMGERMESLFDAFRDAARDYRSAQ